MDSMVDFSREIIETYWNVNLPADEEEKVDAIGNNRNILECKLSSRHLFW